MIGKGVIYGIGKISGSGSGLQKVTVESPEWTGGVGTMDWVVTSAETGMTGSEMIVQVFDSYIPRSVHTTYDITGDGEVTIHMNMDGNAAAGKFFAVIIG